MRRALAMVALAVLSACGELENEPLMQGEVRGQLNGVEVTTALVSVMGLPDLHVELPSSGMFELDNVPQGEIELFTVASQTRAIRVPVTVHGGAITNVGVIEPRPAAYVALHLAAAAHQRLSNTTVHVHGTPLTYHLTDDGHARIGPLPGGCYDLLATAPGFGEVKQGVCVMELDEFDLDLPLPETDGTAGHEGCLVSGCMDTYVCQTDGTCQ